MIAESELSYETYLDTLLGESIVDAQDRERSTFEKAVTGSGRRVVIYGAGNLGQKVLLGLKFKQVELVAFADADPKLWNKRLHGVMVYAPKEAAALFGDNALFLVAIWHPTSSHGVESILGSLRNLGCHNAITFVPLFWSQPETFLPYYLWDLPSRMLAAADDVRRAFTLFGEVESRAEYVRQVRLRLRGDFACLKTPASHPQYFPNLFDHLADEHFVDCGAYDGDTIRSFLEGSDRRFGKVVAFEPDPHNVKRLRESLAAYPELMDRVVVYPFAIGDRAGTVRFNASSASSSCVSEFGDLDVPCTTLDQVVDRATFIKMDIEGSELSALKGAQATIQRDRPVLAICVYHQQEHLWEIPLFIAAQLDRATFSLRSYCADGFESVCYAVPLERSRP